MSRSEGKSDLITLAVHSAVNPVSAKIGNQATITSDYIYALVNARSLKKENTRLKELALSAQLYQQRERALVQQLDDLRRFMALPRYGAGARVAATVIGYFPSEYRVTISAGARQGVKQGMPVVAGTGLLGVVQTVENSYSQVLLLSAPRSGIGAMVLREKPIAGLINKSQSPDRLVLDFLENNLPMEIGDWVVTSGLSERIPANIPIGRIIEIQNEPDFGIRRAIVAPNAQPGLVREVFILK